MDKKETNENKQDNLIDKNFDEIIADGFNRYAKYIIQDRALPELRDGLKPVQRRILFAMYKLNLFHDSQFKKSARTVGDVLGKYHPHGDSSIYEALIRMGQNWKNNLVQVDIHGNKGSIDDDPAAAMRYTEARLSAYGEELLNHIEKKIYPFINNFDDTETEPTILSCLLPNLLINGASGIAAGYATSIPTFNLTELLNVIIAKIKKPNLSLNEVLKIMPGPDFPTGGNLYNLEEIKKCYLEGEGKIAIQASYHFVPSQKKQRGKIIITDVPYETIKSDIVAEIENLRLENKLPGIVSVLDATDKNGIAIELETNDDNINVKSIMQFLYKKTQLQVNFNANMVVIYNKKPIKVGVIKYIDLYLDAAIEIIIKVEQYLLQEDEDRYEIVLGLIKAISVLDEIIKIIRASKDKQDSINNLIAQFAFSHKQAEAIVLLRLYKLSNTDITLLQAEKETLEEKIKTHNLIINNKQEQQKTLINELNAYIKKFGYNRRSKIQTNNELEKNDVSIKDLLTEKEVQIIITNNNQIKWVQKLETDWNKFNLINYKTNDDYLKFIFVSNIKNTLIFFTNLGRMISLDVFKISEAKWKETGEDLINKLHLLAHEKIIACFDLETIKDEKYKNFLFSTKSGKAKQVPKTELVDKKEIRLSNCIKLDDNDELVEVNLIKHNDEMVLAFSNKGYCLKFALNQIPVVSLKAKGVFIMKLNKNDALVKLVSTKQNDNVAFDVFLNTYYKLLNSTEIKETNRYLMGTNLLNNKKNEEIIGVFEKQDQTYYGYNKNNEFVNLSDLVINNANNWLSLDHDLASIHSFKKV